MTLMFDESETLSVVSILFRQEFEDSFSTKLVGGAHEPLYLPKNGPGTFSLLKFRSNFLSSALHEVGHWCIAGETRRKLKDFGYWYNPDGRSEDEQEAFELVEVKPQALEWMFSIACNHSFHISLDNLAMKDYVFDGQNFLNAVTDQIVDWCCSDNMPPRGLQFLVALSLYFNTNPKSIDHYLFKGL